jgi:hypothetical protein
MPSLSLIATEAQHLIGPLEEARRYALQEALLELCETHWQELRGPLPDAMLDQALWSITPYSSDLLIDLYAAGDMRLDDIVAGYDLSQALALLVLAEIERGNEEGVHIAHEPMMAFETAPPPKQWLENVSSLLRGTLTPPLLHRHSRHESLWKALAVMAEKTRRLDLPAVLQIILLLPADKDLSDKSTDKALDALRHEVLDAGVRFLDIDDDYVYFEQHGHTHKPVRIRHLGEIMLEIRQAWLR